MMEPLDLAGMSQCDKPQSDMGRSLLKGQWILCSLLRTYGSLVNGEEKRVRTKGVVCPMGESGKSKKDSSSLGSQTWLEMAENFLISLSAAGCDSGV